MPSLHGEELLPLVRRILEGLGAPPESACVVAAHLVEANLAGHDSHGVVRLAQYRDDVRAGRIHPGAQPRPVRETATTALLDGNLAWGQVVAERAVDLAVEKAAAHQVAAVCARNCYHVGRVGVYPARAARKGFICLVHANGHGIARVAPWGGREPRLATNPLAVAVPAPGEPVVLDITTSVVAEGKVRVARSAGKKVPAGWVLDRDGHPAVDPGELYNGGSLLPLGGEQGHKGYGLSVIVDLLGGVLSGAGCGFLTERVGNGLFVQVTDPEAFMERGHFLRAVGEYVRYLKDCPRREGVDEILLPGEVERREEARRRREGIEIDAATWARIEEIAREVGAGAALP